MVALVVVFATGFLMPLYLEYEASQISPLAFATIEKRGEGEVYANGSVTNLVKGRVPFRVTLEARPAKHWKLSNWLIGGNRQGSNPITLTMWTNVTLIAVFGRDPCEIILRRERLRR